MKCMNATQSDKTIMGKISTVRRIAKIINENWETVKKFASEEDMTMRIAGMKFPKEGYNSK